MHSLETIRKINAVKVESLENKSSKLFKDVVDTLQKISELTAYMRLQAEKFNTNH